MNIFKKEYEEKYAKANPLMAGGENVQAGFNPYQENEGTVMGK